MDTNFNQNYTGHKTLEKGYKNSWKGSKTAKS